MPGFAPNHELIQRSVRDRAKGRNVGHHRALELLIEDRAAFFRLTLSQIRRKANDSYRRRFSNSYPSRPMQPFTVSPERGQWVEGYIGAFIQVKEDVLETIPPHTDIYEAIKTATHPVEFGDSEFDLVDFWAGEVGYKGNLHQMVMLPSVTAALAHLQGQGVALEDIHRTHEGAARRTARVWSGRDDYRPPTFTLDQRAVKVAPGCVLVMMGEDTRIPRDLIFFEGDAGEGGNIDVWIANYREGLPMEVCEMDPIRSAGERLGFEYVTGAFGSYTFSKDGEEYTIETVAEGLAMLAKAEPAGRNKQSAAEPWDEHRWQAAKAGVDAAFDRLRRAERGLHRAQEESLAAKQAYDTATALMNDEHNRNPVAYLRHYQPYEGPGESFAPPDEYDADALHHLESRLIDEGWPETAERIARCRRRVGTV